MKAKLGWNLINVEWGHSGHQTIIYQVVLG